VITLGKLRGFARSYKLCQLFSIKYKQMHLKFFYKFHFMVFLPPQLAKEWWKTTKYYNSLPGPYTSKKEKLVMKL